MPCDSLGEDGVAEQEQHDTVVKDSGINKQEVANQKSPNMAVAMSRSPVHGSGHDRARTSSSAVTDASSSFSSSKPEQGSNRTTMHCSSSNSSFRLGLEMCEQVDRADDADHHPILMPSSFRTASKVPSSKTEAGTTTTAAPTPQQEQSEARGGYVEDEARETRPSPPLLLEDHITGNNTTTTSADETTSTKKVVVISKETHHHRDASASSTAAISATEIVIAGSAASPLLLPQVASACVHTPSSLPITATQDKLNTQPQETLPQPQQQQDHSILQDTAMCLADMGPCDTSEASTTLKTIAEVTTTATDTPIKTTTTEDTDTKPGSSKGKRKRSSSGSSKVGQTTTGRWTQEEHHAFLEGLKECGREWKKVAMRIPTRTSAQIRSHAQKYFAKLQRDDETNHHHLLSPPNGVPSTSYSSVAPDGDPLTGSTITTTHSSSSSAHHLAPSIQKNVERIIADPQAAQQEVEYTLEALRERYRQLQLRLENRRQRRQRRHGDDGDDGSNNNNFPSPGNLPPSSGAALLQNARHLSHRRVLHESPRLAAAADENSSVSSTIASIAASRENLGNDEILALQVLGGDLPRGDSSVEDNGSTGIPTAVDVEEASANHSTLGTDSMDLDPPDEHESAPAAQEAKNEGIDEASAPKETA